MSQVFDVKQFRIAQKISQTQLAEKCGVGLRTVQNWEMGKTTPNYMKLMEAFGVQSLNDLKDGFIDEDDVMPDISQSSKRLMVLDTYNVPIVHIDSVGGIHSGNDIDTPEYIEGYIPVAGARDGDLAIYQSGVSMSPAIPPGAILLIREVPGWREYIGYGDVFVLLLDDGRRITKEIRRYELDPINYYWCVSYNETVADEELPKKMIRRVWKVIKIMINKGW